MELENGAALEQVANNCVEMNYAGYWELKVVRTRDFQDFDYKGFRNIGEQNSPRIWGKRRKKMQKAPTYL